MKTLIAAMSLGMDNQSFAACGNTSKKRSEKKGERLTLLDKADMVPSGVVRLVELQVQVYAYVKP